MIRTIGSLCSGIGGLDLGIEWATGAETLWQVEINDYARAILERHWPNAVQYTDVRNVGKRNLPPVDLTPRAPRAGAKRRLPVIIAQVKGSLYTFHHKIQVPLGFAGRRKDGFSFNRYRLPVIGKSVQFCFSKRIEFAEIGFE